MGKLEKELRDKILRISAASDPDTIPPTHVSEPIDLLRRIVDIRTSEDIFRSDELFASDADLLSAANSCIRALYFSTPLQSGHRILLTYLYHWSDNLFKISLADYDEDEATATTIVSEFQFVGDVLTDLEDTNGNVIGKIFASVSGYSGSVSQADMAAVRMPYCNEICWNLNQAKMLDTKISSLQSQASGVRQDLDALQEELFPTLFGTNGTFPSDVVKCAAANAEVKALYLNQQPASGHRYVLTWLYLQNSSPKWWFVSILDLDISAGTTTYVTQEARVADKEVSPLLNSGGTQVGLIYLDSDNYTVISDQGEGAARLPYLMPAAFNQLDQQMLLNAEVGETSVLAKRTSSRVNTIEAELFPTLLGTAGTEPSDVVKCAAANAEVKALYLSVKPATGHRFVLHALYLQASDLSWYFTITDYNVTSGTSSTLVNYLHADNKQMSVITDVNGNDIGWILLDSDHYTLISDQGEGLARLPYLLGPAFDIATQTRLFRQAVSEQIAAIEKRMTKKQILCWGDSITWGAAASANSKCYTARLQTMLTEAGYIHKVVNCGVGGDNMPSILGRMGASMLYLTKDLTIPKNSANHVVVDTVANYVQVGRYLKSSIAPNEQIQLMMQGDLGRPFIDDPERDLFHTVNPVIVNGVECVWSWVPEQEGQTDEGEFRLSVKETQSAAVVLKAGSPIFTHGAKIKTDAAVFAMGTNAGWSTPEEYIRMIDAAIDACGTKKYIVCSPYGGTALNQQGVSGLQELESALTAAYGSKFFNWRKFLVEDALALEGVTPTSDDTTAIAQGKCPPSLLADEVHPNDYGHDAIALRLYQMMQSLGYFD